MHDYSVFLPYALGLGVVFFVAALAIGIWTRSVYNRHTVSNNLALAVERTDRQPKHVGPRRNKYSDGAAHNHSHRNGHANRAAVGAV